MQYGSLVDSFDSSMHEVEVGLKERLCFHSFVVSSLSGPGALVGLGLEF